MTGSSSLSELYDNSVDGVVIVENHSRDTQKPTDSNLAGIGTGFIISKMATFLQMRMSYPMQKRFG